MHNEQRHHHPLSNLDVSVSTLFELPLFISGPFLFRYYYRKSTSNNANVHRHKKEGFCKEGC